MRILVFICTIPFTLSFELFGGGCFIKDEQIILAGAFIGASAKLSEVSYILKLSNKLEIPKGSDLIWGTSKSNNFIPGDLTLKKISDGKVVLFQLVGGMFSEISFAKKGSNTTKQGELLNFHKKNLSHNVLDPLGKTSLAKSFEDIIVKSEESREKSPALDLDEESLVGSSPREEYFSALNKVLRIAFFHNAAIIYLENFESPFELGAPVEVVTILNIQDSQITIQATTGPKPKFRGGFSVTQRRNKVYLTGGKLNEDREGYLIHILDLDTFKWEEHKVEGFSGSRSGCLVFHKNLLIHAFGKDGDRPVSKTQFVSTLDWKLRLVYYPDGKEPLDKNLGVEKSGLILKTIIISLTLGIFTLTILAWVTRRKLGRGNYLKPPEFHTKALWSDPSFNDFDMDLSFDCSPFESYDSTLVSKNMTHTHVNQ